MSVLSQHTVQYNTEHIERPVSPLHTVHTSIVWFLFAFLVIFW